MIYSRFGTALTLVSKTQSAGGQLSVQATTDATGVLHEYGLSDLKADDGHAEISAAVDKLPVRVVENKTTRRQKNL